MKSFDKKPRRYNFYVAKFWLAALLSACSVLTTAAVIKIIGANDNLQMLMLTAVLFVASRTIIKCLILLVQPRKPVITILPDRIILANKNPKEILFSDINSIKLAKSGLDMFSQSLLIFLNSTSDSEDSDLPVISVPLFFVKADRKHLLQLLKLHLGRKSTYVTVTPVMDWGWQEI